MSDPAISLREVAEQLPKDDSSGRLYYLDWLRVIAILGVFLYHASRPFILQEWLIANDEKSIAVTFFS